MTFLFLLSILFAIPTFGLSVLAWLFYFFWAARNNAKDRVSGLNHMRATRSVVASLVGGDTAEFYRSLYVPKTCEEGICVANDSQCGRHILNFISYNPDITQEFMQALNLHRLKGSASLPTIIEAIEFERDWQFRPLHNVCYFAIVTLTSQNRLPCFDDVDIPSMIKKTSDFPESMILKN